MSSSADDLFDSDNDDDDEEEVVVEMQPSGGAVSPASGEQLEEPQAASDEDTDANVGADAPGRLVLQVTMPELTTGATASKLRVVKPGKLVSLNPHRFDPAQYDEADEVDYFTNAAASDDGTTAPMPTKIVRWRAKRGSDGELLKNADGSFVAESNARIVRWSDGTMSLAVGAAPMLHISNVPVPKDQSYVFVKQMQTQVGSASNETAPDDDALPETSLECVGVVGETMALRPAVMDADLEHTIVQKHAMSNATRSRKGLKTVRTSKDPEAEMLRRQQDRSEALRKERKTREGDQGAFMRRNQRDLAHQKNAAYLEGDGSSDSDENEYDESDESDDDVSQSTRFTRASRKRGRDEDAGSSSGDDEGDAELEGPAAKMAKVASSGASSSGVAPEADAPAAGEDGGNEDEEDDDFVSKKSQRKGNVSAMMDDEEEED
jgi:RNA polymerase-associated protein LEO1